MRRGQRAEGAQIFLGVDGRTIIHNRARQLSYTYVARLLLELANRALLGSLASIDQAGGNFDDNLIDWWAILLLQK